MPIEDKISAVADTYGVEQSEVKEIFEEKLAAQKESTEDDVDDSTLEMGALVRTKGELREDDATSGSSSSGSGESKEVSIVSLGYNDMGKHTWGNDETYLYGYGVAKPDEEDAHPGVFLLQEANVGDLDAVMDKFSALNSLSGEFTVSSRDIGDGRYVFNTTPDTDVREKDANMSFEERRDWVANEHLPDVGLDSLADSLSNTNSDGYTTDFGVDMKRFRGSIVDATIDSDGQWGVYTVQDDTVVDLSELDDDIQGQARKPGVSIWCNPERMDYGEHSIVDFYGTIERGDNGQITMSASSVVPILSNEIDLAEATLNNGSGGSSSDTEAREQSI